MVIFEGRITIVDVSRFMPVQCNRTRIIHFMNHLGQKIIEKVTENYENES